MSGQNRYVLVTGASTGIGAAAALHLAELGFQVFAGVRRPADGDQLAAKAETLPGRIVPVLLDVTSGPDIARAAETVTAAVGPAGLWGLVNNAGVAVPGPLEFLPVDELRRQLEVNVTGQVAVTQALLPLLRQARGRIVNMGSVSGRVASPFLGAYAASKFALEALTTALRAELYPWGIQVAIITPGVIKTPIWQKSAADFRRTLDRMPPKATTLYGSLLAAMEKRIGRAEERGAEAVLVASAVAHALTARTARRRYPIGSDARMVEWIRRLPEALREAMVLRRLYGSKR